MNFDSKLIAMLDSEHFLIKIMKIVFKILFLCFAYFSLK